MKLHWLAALGMILIWMTPIPAMAEVYVSGETHGGKKVTLYIDYNTYGGGDLYQGAVLTISYPNGRSIEAVFDSPTGKESDMDVEGSSEHSVDLFKKDGKWQLMVMFKRTWAAGNARLLVRYLAQNFDDKPSPKDGIKNGVNILELDWPEKDLKGVVLRELRGSGVPGDEWELSDQE